MKQLRLLNAKSFTQEERIVFRAQIHEFILRNIKILLQGRTLHQNGNYIINLNLAKDQELPDEAWPIIDSLWQNHAIKRDFINRSFPGIDDNVGMFLDRLELIKIQDYIPTDDDILLCSHRTEAITETVIPFRDKKIRLVDLVGQTLHRTKWANYFTNDITGIIFVLSAIGYCQTVLENEDEKNRLIDALEVFESLVHHPMLDPKSFIVFVNKMDLLPQRLMSHPVRDFIDYKPDLSKKDPLKQYIHFLFNNMERIISKRKKPLSIFYHRTTAVDSKIMSKIIHIVM